MGGEEERGGRVLCSERVNSRVCSKSRIQIDLENCDRDRDVVKLFYFRDRID